MTALPAISLILAMAIYPASAQTIDEACLEAARLYLRADAVEAGAIEAFPELTPPRANVAVTSTRKGSGDAVAALLGGANKEVRQDHGTFSCEFEAASVPFGLTKLCPDEGCIFEDPKRTEEIRVMLQRSGY